MQAKDTWSHWTFRTDASGTTNGTALQASYGDYERIAESVSVDIAFIGDTDPAVRAAGAQLILATQRDCEILGTEQGYFTTGANPSSCDPLIQWFAVEEVLPMDRKKIKHYLRSTNVGVLEIKVRDAPIVPEVLRKELKLSGKESRTLLVTRIGKKLIAVVARRC
jgi:hypothetical protein